MRSKLPTLGLALILIVLFCIGCGPVVGQPTEVSTFAPTEPVAEPLAVVPATTPTVAVEASDAQAARDAALTYLVEHYTEQPPGMGLTWTEEFTPERPFHLPHYQYAAAAWVVTISYRSVPVLYQVVAVNQATGFRWEGMVDVVGQVTEQLALDDVRAAGDAALSYIIEHYGEEIPELGLAWTEEHTTPEVWSGAGTYRYTAEDWVVAVYYPMIPPETVVYLVTVANPATGFHWEGQVDSAGRVSEVLEDVMAARDAALGYLNERHSKRVPAPGSVWTEDVIGVPVPEGPWGAGTLQYAYRAEDWVVSISYQFLDPKPVLYQVVVTNLATHFHWEGEIDANGRVTEEVAPE